MKSKFRSLLKLVHISFIRIFTANPTGSIQLATVAKESMFNEVTTFQVIIQQINQGNIQQISYYLVENLHNVEKQHI